MPAPVTIQNRPLIARLLLFFWAAEVGVGLLFGLAGVRLLGPSENGGAALLMLFGLILTAAGLIMTGLCWRIASLRGPAIEMSDEGLLDRRLSPKRLPWEAIGWKVIFNGRSYSVQMDLAPQVRRETPIYWPQRALGLFSRLLRQPEFTIATMGTGRNAHDLARLIDGFRPSVH